MSKSLISTSKFLSLVLRHDPASIGLQLDPSGWASLEELIACAALHGTQLTPELVREVVLTSDKQRFVFDSGGGRIRANQGHSVDVDLGLSPIAPPDCLYHGTATRFLISIQATGLVSQGRQFVHLSLDIETARLVGARHGVPTVVTVRAGDAALAGHLFYRSANGVWLVREVPLRYLEFAGSQP